MKHDPVVSGVPLNTTTQDEAAPLSKPLPTSEVFLPEVWKLIDAYGYGQLKLSVGRMVQLRDKRQKVVTKHVNSILRDEDVRLLLIGKSHTDRVYSARQAVLSMYWHVRKTSCKKELENLLDDPNASQLLLEDKVIGNPLKPGKVGLLVTGRPDVVKGGVRIPDAAFELMDSLSKQGLTITRDVLWMLASINRLPDSLIRDHIEREDVDVAEVDGAGTDLEPISHRHHLLRAYSNVKRALREGISTLFDRWFMDGTSRIHASGTVTHQGPDGIRCLHAAPTSKEVSLEDMRIFAWHLGDHYGIDYREVSSLLADGVEGFIHSGSSMNAAMACRKFQRAARSGKTDFLFEGDGNISLGTIKGLIVGCLVSLRNVGMLGFKRPDTWMSIARRVAKKCQWFRRLPDSASKRKNTKRPGTPGGYGASPNTMGLAILGLDGAKVGETVITSLDDLLVPTYDGEGNPEPREKWETLPLRQVESLCRPEIVEAMRKQAATEPGFQGAAFSTGMLYDYAEEGGDAVREALVEELPCIPVFSKVVQPNVKAQAKADGGIVRLVNPFNWIAMLPLVKLDKDKNNTKEVRIQVHGRTRTTKMIKAVKNKSILGAEPYVVFGVESSAVIRTWQRIRERVDILKPIHDALLCRIQDVRLVNDNYLQALVDSVEMLDMSQFSLTEEDKSGRTHVLIDLDARAQVLSQVRKEGNAWGIPSDEELQEMFPDLEGFLNGANPNIWKLGVPKEKAIVLCNFSSSSA